MQALAAHAGLRAEGTTLWQRHAWLLSLEWEHRYARVITRAAVRAVEDALWRNSVSFAEAFGFEKSDMLIDIQIGVQKPAEVEVTR